MKKQETFEWIKKVIKSCKTYDQTKAAFKLIKRFEVMYNDDEMMRVLYNAYYSSSPFGRAN